MNGELLKAASKRFCIVVIFGVAFGYIEAAVVVYLRAIFYPDGFVFPLTGFGVGQLWRRVLLTEIGREAATLVLISMGAWLFGANRRQRFGYFLVIFAVWDIFYYVWLKVLVDWPGSIMDWDILFLMPVAWASPVLAPVLVSLMIFLFAAVILYRDCRSKGFNVSRLDAAGFSIAALAVIASFCIAGLHIQRVDFESHFYWQLFAAGYLSVVGLFLKSIRKSG